MKRSKKTFLAGVLLLGFAVPVRSADPSPEDQDRAKLAAMEAKIDKLIGKAACGAAGECRQVPFGVKPCGGPSKYKITSARAGKLEGLLQQINEYNALNTKLNLKHGWTSDCSVVMPPVVECRDGRCATAGK